MELLERESGEDDGEDEGHGDRERRGASGALALLQSHLVQEGAERHDQAFHSS